MAEPPYASILYEVREPLLRSMDRETRRTCRLVDKAMRDMVHEEAKALVWLPGVDGYALSQDAVALAASRSNVAELPYSLLRCCPNLRHLSAAGMQRLSSVHELPAGVTSLDLSRTKMFSQPAFDAFDGFQFPASASAAPQDHAHDVVQQAAGPSTALSSFQACKALHTLRLDRVCYWTLSALDLQPLSVCSELRELYVTRCWGLTDLSPLSACTQLQRLECSRCQVTSLSPLAACKALTYLDASRNFSTADLAPLAACTALQHLTLSYCRQITSLAPLAACRQLQHLRLRGCRQLVDLSGLAACNALQYLDLSKCTLLTSISPLAACTALEKLVIAWSAVSSSSLYAVVAACKDSLKVVENNYFTDDTASDDSVTEDVDDEFLDSDSFDPDADFTTDIDDDDEDFYPLEDELDDEELDFDALEEMHG